MSTGPKEFISILAELDSGEVNMQLTELLPEVVAAVAATKLSGSLTLEIKIVEKGGAIVLTPTVKIKKPQPEKNATLFFCDEEGNLFRNDPRQTEMRGIDQLPAATVTRLREIKGE